MKKLIILIILLFSTNIFSSQPRVSSRGSSKDVADECTNPPPGISEEESDELADKCKLKYDEEKYGGREPASTEESVDVDSNAPQTTAHDCYLKKNQEEVDSCLDSME